MRIFISYGGDFSHLDYVVTGWCTLCEAFMPSTLKVHIHVQIYQEMFDIEHLQEMNNYAI